MQPPSTFTRLPQDVLNLTLDQLSLADIQALRKTCVAADIIASSYWSHRFDTLLCHYFSDTRGVLEELNLTSSVFSGSFVLWVLSRPSWHPQNLDIYTPHDYFAHVVSYLIAVEGYDIVRPLPPSPSNPNQGVAAAVILGHPSGRSVQVAKSTSMCSLLPLASFTTTATMAYCTGDASVCMAYPVLTAKSRTILNATRLLDLQYALPPVLDVIQKFERRGFGVRLHEYAWRQEKSKWDGCDGADTECCPLTVRWFGDKLCMHVRLRRFGTPCLVPPPLCFLDELTALWWRGGVSCGGACRGPDEGMEPGAFTMPRYGLLQ